MDIKYTYSVLSVTNYFPYMVIDMDIAKRLSASIVK